VPVAVLFAPEVVDRSAVDHCVDVSDVLGVLSELTPALASAPTNGCTVEQLQHLADAARAAQRGLDGFVTRLGMAADRLVERDRTGLGARELLGARRGGVRSSTARRDAARAATAAVLPVLADAVAQGRVGGDQLDIMARAIKDLEDNQVSLLNTDELVTAAEQLPADTFNRMVQREVEDIKGDDGLADAVEKRQDSSFRWWFDERAGMGRLSGRLDPERYETVTNALEQAMTRLASHGSEPVGKDHRLAADALVHLATGGSRSGLPAITVIVDADTLTQGGHHNSVRETADGRPVPPDTIARLACDATIRKVLLDGTSVPIDVGRRYRTATDAQWAAIKAIYSTCGWDGCSAPISWCQLHHIHEWERGGATDLCNLLPLCHRHHHQVHEGGWRIVLRTDRSLKIYRPDGKHWSTTPPPSRRPTRRAGPGATRRNAASAGFSPGGDPP
jgi:hypothetical protein